MLHPQYVQMKPKKTKKGKRPKSAGKKRTTKIQQQYQYNAENIDPNMLQQMIMAQSQQAARPPRQTVKKRPSTSKPKKAGPPSLKF